MELDPRITWPLDAIHPERRPQQPVAGGEVVFLRHAQRQEGRVHEENEGAARTQETGRLRDPAIWVSPQARAVLGDRKVEARIGIRDLLGVAVDKREIEFV